MSRLHSYRNHFSAREFAREKSCKIRCTFLPINIGIPVLVVLLLERNRSRIFNLDSNEGKCDRWGKSYFAYFLSFFFHTDGIIRNNRHYLRQRAEYTYIIPFDIGIDTNISFMCSLSSYTESPWRPTLIKKGASNGLPLVAQKSTKTTQNEGSFSFKAS